MSDGFILKNRKFLFQMNKDIKNLKKLAKESDDDVKNYILNALSELCGGIAWLSEKMKCFCILTITNIFKKFTQAVNFNAFFKGLKRLKRKQHGNKRNTYFSQGGI